MCVITMPQNHRKQAGGNLKRSLSLSVYPKAGSTILKPFLTDVCIA